MLDPLLQTDDVTRSSLYTEQLLCAHVLTQRGLCTEKLLHTGWKKHSSAEPALLLFELLFVFLLPLPDHLPFLSSFPSPFYSSILLMPMNLR